MGMAKTQVKTLWFSDLKNQRTETRTIIAPGDSGGRISKLRELGVGVGTPKFYV